jgi:glycosyltransferase involved in cell wall biosynthesis
MNIDIILPYKEIFSEDKASAVSLTIKNSAEFSEFNLNINIFGQMTPNPFKGLKFNGIKTNKFLHFGNNNSILINYFKIISNASKYKRLLEIHNRPYLFHSAFAKEKNNPITLHFHNDPREMRGSKKIKERIFIAKNAAAVYFVSEYIKQCFLDGLDDNFDNLYVLPNAIQRTLVKQPTKAKEILFVGRLVASKGCHLYVDAIRELVKNNQDWTFKIIGTPKAGQRKLKSNYAIKLIKDFESLGLNTQYLGFISNEKVADHLKNASIMVVPSIWQEPFALTALEGMCNGAAIIASKVGGMAEMLVGIGLLIEDIDAEKLKESINALITNKKLLKFYQDNSWNKYQYNQKDIVKKQDFIRRKIFDTHKL